MRWLRCILRRVILSRTRPGEVCCAETHMCTERMHGSNTDMDTRRFRERRAGSAVCCDGLSASRRLYESHAMDARRLWPACHATIPTPLLILCLSPPEVASLRLTMFVMVVPFSWKYMMASLNCTGSGLRAKWTFCAFFSLSMARNIVAGNNGHQMKKKNSCLKPRVN